LIVWVGRMHRVVTTVMITAAEATNLWQAAMFEGTVAELDRVLLEILGRADLPPQR